MRQFSDLPPGVSVNDIPGNEPYENSLDPSYVAAIVDDNWVPGMFDTLREIYPSAKVSPRKYENTAMARIRLARRDGLISECEEQLLTSCVDVPTKK